MRRLFAMATLILAQGTVSIATAQEPGLEGRDDVLLQTSFEADDWYTDWGLDEAPRNAHIVADEGSFRGETLLRVEVPAGEHYGTSFGFQFADQGLEEPEEIYFRYAIRLGPDWTTEGGGGGKFPGFGGTYGEAGWGGRPSDGNNGWSSRMLFWQPEEGRAEGDTRIGYYAYHADMQGTYGDNWFWSGGPIGAGGALEVSRWYQIEAYVRLNTPGDNDGVLEGWVDGTQVFERTDVRFRDVDNLKIERVWFDLYYGGNWTAPRDMYVDFDNAVIARNPIGPVADAPPDPSPDMGATPDAGTDGGGDETPGTGEGTPDADAPETSTDVGPDDPERSSDGTATGCCATTPRPLAPQAMLLACLLLVVRRLR